MAIDNNLWVCDKQLSFFETQAELANLPKFCPLNISKFLKKFYFEMS